MVLSIVGRGAFGTKIALKAHSKLMFSSQQKSNLENFVISPFDAARDTNNFVHCISQNFSTGEPHSLAIGLTKSDLELILYHFLTCDPDTAKLCAVIHEKNSGKFVACIGSEDIHSSSEEGFAKIVPKWSLSTSLMEKACKFDDFDLIKKSKRGETVHLFFCGIGEGYAGQNLLSTLVQYNLSFAANSGYKYAITEPTHPVSQRICQKLGFEIKSNVLFDTFEHNGVRPFKGIEGSLPIVMHKDLSVFKTELK